MANFPTDRAQTWKSDTPSTNSNYILLNLINTYLFDVLIALLNVESFRCCLHENYYTVLEDWDGCEQNQESEYEGAYGVNDLPVRLDVDDDCSNDNSDTLHDVTNDVDDSSPHVHVLMCIVMLMSCKTVVVMATCALHC
jgi:hypothetical protein